jgi:general stress protein YciG
MSKKLPAAVELGRRGGKARAQKLTKKQREEIARKAGQARWQ